MILDACLFNDELDALEFRLRLLSSHVDYFLICEADKDFNGNPKPFHYWDNRERFRPWRDRVLHWPIRIDTHDMHFPTGTDDGNLNVLSPSYGPMAIRKIQWNSICDAMTAPRKDLLEIGIKSDTILMIGAVSEYPSRKALEWAAEWITADAQVVCRQASLRDINTVRHEYQFGTVLTVVRQALISHASTMRQRRRLLSFIPDGGWALGVTGGDVRESVMDTPQYPAYFRDACKQMGWM